MTDPNDDIRLLYESTWLSAPDLRGRDITLTIARVKGGEVVGDKGKKNRKPILYWAEKMTSGKEIKAMPLNKTNWKTIKDLYGTGNSIKALVGLKLTLYATTCRSADGNGQVDCVRIKNVKPDSKKPAESLQEAPQEERQPGEEG